jgi:nucleoside-diphosphate kinase
MAEMERSLIVFKPDVVQRQIVGEILQRFERKGFKIIGMKMVNPSKDLIGKHYSNNKDYLESTGSKVRKGAEERGEKVKESDYELGLRVRDWCIEYLTCGPVIAMVLEGWHVIELVRKALGSTNPRTADIGTIRSDYTPDSYVFADMQGRVTRTMVHASDSRESAKREIPLWFNNDELFKYETAIEKILYDAGWSK